jgi:hypothetical protein
VKLALAIVASLLALVGNIPYIRGILRRTVEPHPYTWLVGALVSTTVLFGQVVKGAGVGALPTAASDLFTIVIFLLSLKYGYKHITKVDTVFLIAALLAMVPWAVSKDPTLSVILVVIIDVVSFVPTLRKTWKEPRTEHPVLYAMNVARHALALLSLEAYNLVTMLHSVVMIVVNAITTVVIVLGVKRVGQ